MVASSSGRPSRKPATRFDCGLVSSSSVPVKWLFNAISKFSSSSISFSWPSNTRWSSACCADASSSFDGLFCGCGSIRMKSAVFYLTNPSPVILRDNRRMLGLDRTLQAQSHKANNSKHQDTRELLSEIRHKKEAIEVDQFHPRKLSWTSTPVRTRSLETSF